MNQTIIKPKAKYTNIENYYRFHAYIYDLTRWSFLFGRRKIIKKIPMYATEVAQVLEIGCGTGQNLIDLAKQFPNARIIGIDISDEMLEKAREKTKKYANIELKKAFLSTEIQKDFDVVVMSYVLTMMNPGWEFWLATAKNLLKENGFFVVVDFHYSPFLWFRKHMKNNHVRMEKHILPVLEKNYKEVTTETCNAYFGVWQYFMFVGKR